MDERKENWTNKLIELLNRYIKEKELWNTVKEIDDDFFVNNYNNWDWYLCEQVISKNFWFIERLVQNNKIDLDEFNCQKRPFYSYIDEEWYVSFKHFWLYSRQ